MILPLLRERAKERERKEIYHVKYSKFIKEKAKARIHEKSWVL